MNSFWVMLGTKYGQSSCFSLSVMSFISAHCVPEVTESLYRGQTAERKSDGHYFCPSIISYQMSCDHWSQSQHEVKGSEHCEHCEHHTYPSQAWHLISFHWHHLHLPVHEEHTVLRFITDFRFTCCLCWGSRKESTYHVHICVCVTEACAQLQAWLHTWRSANKERAGQSRSSALTDVFHSDKFSISNAPADLWDYRRTSFTFKGAGFRWKQAWSYSSQRH